MLLLLATIFSFAILEVLIGVWLFYGAPTDNRLDPNELILREHLRKDAHMYGRRIYDDEFGFSGGGGVLYPTEYAAIEQERFAETSSEVTEIPIGRALDGLPSDGELVTESLKFVADSHVQG